MTMMKRTPFTLLAVFFAATAGFLQKENETKLRAEDIGYIVKAVLGLRPDPEAEQQGLDLSDHGEEGYILEAKG